MRKELTWIAATMLASLFIVFVLFGDNTLDLRVKDTVIILPSWTWAFPVFFLLAFIILFTQIQKEKYSNAKRCTAFLVLGSAMFLLLVFLRSYFVKLDTYLDNGKLAGLPSGTRELFYSRHTLGVLTFLQMSIIASMLFVIYFCWIRTSKSHVNHRQN